MTTPNDVSLALGGTEAGMAAARGYGLATPPGYEHAEACLTEARRLADAPPAPAFPGLPDDPAKLEQAIRKAATAQGVQDAMREMTHEAARYAAAAMTFAYRSALPGYIAQLSDIFGETVEQFTTARGVAGDRLTEYDDDDAVTAHMALLKAAAKLDTLAAARLNFASTIGESGVHHTLPWHVIKPPAADEPERVNHMRDVLTEMRSDLRGWHARTAITRWSMLHAAGDLSIAPLGEVQNRRDEWDRVKYAAASTPAKTMLGTQIDQADRAAAITR